MALNIPSSVLAGAGLLAFAGLLAAFGPTAQDINAHEQAAEQHLAELKVQAEPMDVTVMGPPLYSNVMGGSRGNYRVIGYNWHSFESADWVFLNANNSKDLCSAILKKFMLYNIPYQSLELPQLTEMLTTHKDKPMPVSAFVPRFTAKPAGLYRCEDKAIGYDEAAKVLTYRGKHLAFLADSGPKAKQ